MKHMVRYKLKADRVAENERLIVKVYDELAASKPPGLHYATFRADDGVSYFHVVFHDFEGAGNALTALPAFKAFTAEIRDRCVEPPARVELTEIGSYRFPGG
jgi:hypothetical protein